MIIESIDILKRDKRAYLVYHEKNQLAEKVISETIDPAAPEPELIKTAMHHKKEAKQAELRIKAIDFEISKLSEN